MAATRSTTGSSRPRQLSAIGTGSERKRTAKPGAGVTKKRAPNTHHKHKTNLKDKVAIAAEKAKGVVEQKPGKRAAGTRRMHGTDGRKSRTARK